TVAYMCDSGRIYRGCVLTMQLLQLTEKPIHTYILDTYQNLDLVDDYTLVFNARYEQLYYDIVDTYRFFKVRRMVRGGATRQASSAAGLEAIGPCDVVVVQDGVRPFTGPRVIMEAVETARRVGADNVPGRGLDPIVESRDGLIAHIPDRANLYSGQSPQAFRYALLV